MATEAQAAFFSYSRDDSEFALRLAADLKAAGANVWLDQLDIAPGQRWARTVQDALNNCPRLLVILSPSSVGSTNVEDEVAFALEEHKTVIPVFYRDCKVPFQLRPFQYVDFRTDYDRGLKTLLRTLGVEQQAAAATGVAASAVPKDIPADVSDADERKRAAEQQRLEQEENRRGQARRRERERQQKLEQERQAAAEQARLEEERRLAAEKAQREEQERERKAAEEKARAVPLKQDDDRACRGRSRSAVGVDPMAAKVKQPGFAAANCRAAAAAAEGSSAGRSRSHRRPMSKSQWPKTALKGSIATLTRT